MNTALRLVVALSVLTFGRVAAAAPELAVDIQPQPLESAVTSWAVQTGYQVLMPAEAGSSGLTTPVVKGTYPPEDVLKALLVGTNFDYGFVNARTVAIRAKAVAPEGAAASASAGSQRLRLAQATESTAPPGGQPGGQTPVETGLPQVIVTATKRDERAQDIPMSIAVIGSQDIDRRGLIGMEDYLRSVPGVNQIDNGPLSNAIVIRGITTSPEFENFSSGTTVASYFDETAITAAAGLGAGGIDVRPVDIERIEILRGPQGSAYGASSLGGTMRLIPARPQLDSFSGRIGATYSDTGGLGSDNSAFQGVINIPLVTDQLGLRAVAYRYDESGFYRNVAGSDPTLIDGADLFGLGDFIRGHFQDDVGRILTTGGRVSMLWQPTERTSLSANYLTQEIEQDGSPVAEVGKYEQARGPVSPQSRMRGEAGEVNDTEIDLMNLVLNHDFGWSSLTSVASWVDGGQANATGAQQGAVAFFGPTSGTGRSDFRSFTAESRIASQLEGRMQFLAGLYYEHVKQSYQGTGDWPGDETSNPFGTNPFLLSLIDRHLDQRAVFGEVSYDLTSRITALVGGRYFEYAKTEAQLQEGGLVTTPLGTGVTQNFANTESDSNFKASLSYKPSTDAMLYASWAQGFRLGRPDPGVPAGACDLDADGVIDGTDVSLVSTQRVNSDFLDNYELGGKFTLLDRRLSIETAVFHIDWNGLPISTFAGDCFFGYTSNAGDATSDGIELQGTFLVTNAFRVDFGAGYTKAELSRDAPSLGAVEGSRLPGSPKVNANLAAQYEFSIGGYEAFIRADSMYVGEFFGDLAESESTKAGDYVKIDARAGVAIRNLSVELFVRNLTDDDAFTWRGLSNANTAFGYRMQPTTFGVQLGYRLD